MNMRGQLVVLDIIAPAAPGSVKLLLSPAELVASGMAGFTHSMSPKSAEAVSGGGVSAYCRVSGKKLVQKGRDQFGLKLATVEGKPALGLTSYTGVSSLAFPEGSASKSYTVVMMVHIPDPATARLNFMTAFTDETAIATVLRYDITTASPTVNRLLAYGNAVNPPQAEIAHSVAGWAAVVVDYDDLTRTVSIAVNGVGDFSEIIKAQNSLADEHSYLEVGYHSSSNGLRLASVGDVFIFNKSLRADPSGMVQLGHLVNELKAEYSVA
ncbi:hypothetical protein WG29040_23165 [Pseudomonas sp. PAMC 29040]|uniref:hypothetical protein n=1 Tax=Pseudomonas sp. PAMC 29040 TaxID=2498450 RepID=UPI000F90D016|nr:hypothetical protein [Pseudomonas sp. PAMC 29040]RUT30842.1 hypothetical protein WG29040_23165 [Pseudomonas sp. PAMC 29040]